MKHLTKEDMEQRIDKGVELFMKGYNCSQSVVGAFCDLYDIPFDLAMRMSASFGGGSGRLRLTCGSANGMFMLAGLENGCTEPVGPSKRAENYALVQKLGKEFKEASGSLICAELLGLRAGKIDPPTPSERTAEYYKSRPCVRMVENACTIYANYLLSRQEEEK